jgi:hypothetical protein
VRLVLDEHYSPKIAEQLRSRDHGVVAVEEREDMRGLTDLELWTRAWAERRAVMTEDVAGFMPLVRQAAAAGERHFGVVFTSPRSLPRALMTVGPYVDRLDGLLRDRPADDALADQVLWLSPE